MELPGKSEINNKGEKHVGENLQRKTQKGVLFESFYSWLFDLKCAEELSTSLNVSNFYRSLYKEVTVKLIKERGTFLTLLLFSELHFSTQ